MAWFNAVLFYFGLIFFPLCLCKVAEKQKDPEDKVLTNSNHHWHHGKLLIGLQSEQDRTLKPETDDIFMDYQSDMALDVPEQKMVEHGFPQYDKTAVERLLRMNPSVICSGGHMRLQVEDSDTKPGALLFVDRGNLPPLSLSKLPKSCGYKVSSTHHNLDMIAPYDGCFVLVTEFCYVLPLRWYGLPVQLSCPVSRTSTESDSTSESDSTPMVTCHRGGIVVKTEWTSALSDIKVNLNNKWEPLTQVSAICNGAVKDSGDMIAISLPYPSPCVEMKDGMHTVKLSGDVDVEVSCPLAPPGFPQIIAQLDVTAAPTPHANTNSHTSQFLMPRMPSQIHSWHDHQPPQHGDNFIGQPFYQISSGFYDHLGQMSISHPDLPFINVFNKEPEHPPQAGNPSLILPLYEGPWLNWPPYNLPQEPVNSMVPPQSTGAPKPEGSTTHPCLYHTTVKPEIKTTAESLTMVPQNYRLYGPYYHPYLVPPLPPTTSSPTPSIQKPQAPSISFLGAGFSKNPHPNFKLPIECLQFCQVGLLECCPQIAIYQHHYHFAPQQQRDKFHSPADPLPEKTTGTRPDSLHGLSQGAQSAPAPPNHRTVSIAPFSSHLYQVEEHQGRQVYQQPQEGSPAALPLNEPLSQTDSSSTYFDHDEKYPHNFDVNQRNPHVQQEGPSVRASSHYPHYSHFFNSAQGSHVYDPYNIQSFHQSDGPSLNQKSLSRSHQYANQFANINERESALIFGNQHKPLIDRQDSIEHISSRQPFNSLSKTQKEYVLLQESPPGRESKVSVPPQHYRQIVQDQYFANNFAKVPLNLKESEDSMRLDGEGLVNVHQTTEEKPGFQPQSSSTGSKSAHLTQDPDNNQYFKYPNRLLSLFERQRTLQKYASP